MPPATQPILQIREVLGPAEQGKSLPFKCVGVDGNLYFVKGQQTNRASLWREWICAHLAQAFGLNIPPFSLVQVDETLHAELPADWRQLGCLPAFGSRQHCGTSWLELGMAPVSPSPCSGMSWYSTGGFTTWTASRATRTCCGSGA